MRRAWMVSLALVGAVVLSVALFATASGRRPPEPPGAHNGVPASIQLTPDPIAIQCDGVDASTVTVRVTDSRGRAVPDGTEVFFDAVYGFVDPVIAETTRGEASTQAHLYPFAGNFLGQTQVDVSVGPLRASIGIDCLPPAPPCGPDASPPCPTPVPCNAPFSPPMPFSPPCEPPLPCSDTQSPPIGPSPPCPTPTPFPCEPILSPPCSLTPFPTRTPPPTPTPGEPSCFPQSPPCEGTPTPFPCDRFASPPCNGTPIGTGTIRFTSYEPIVGTVGDAFVLTLEVIDPSILYEGYQYRVFTSAIAPVTGDVPSPAHGRTLCVQPFDVGFPEFSYYGGCLHPTGLDSLYVGELTTIGFSCVSPGIVVVGLLGDSPFPTSLLASGGAAFGGPDPRVVDVTCVGAQATATPTPALGLRPFIIP